METELQQAERFAREQQKAWVAGVRWMCEKFAEAPEVVRAAFTPDKGDIVFYCGERIENVAATLYPAPTERKGAQECPCGRVRQLCGTVGCSNPANRPTPPQAAPEPGVIVPSRIWLPVKDGKVCINPRDAANFALMADAHAEASHDASGRGE